MVDSYIFPYSIAGVFVCSKQGKLYKVRTGGRYNVRSKGRMCGLIFKYLLALIIHNTKHASTRECAHDNKSGVA